MNRPVSPARTTDWQLVGHDAGIKLSARWPVDGRLQLMRHTEFDGGPARVIEVPPGLEEALTCWLLAACSAGRIRVDVPPGKALVDAADLERLTLAARAVTGGGTELSEAQALFELDKASEPFSDTLPMAAGAESD